MLERVAYQIITRHEYRLTEKGRAFWDVLAAMWRWGTDWQWPQGDGPSRVEGPRDRRRRATGGDRREHRLNASTFGVCARRPPAGAGVVTDCRR